ncbi:MAG: insulinase family protein [Firmicutes bacterium]|jgi:predicted Zn-dependent peptidase|nr:insulinase family protein [Bacillota bacterium]
MKLDSLEIDSNKTAFWLPSQEHVTTQIKIWLTQPLEDKIFSKAFLLASLLRRGTENYPSQQLMVQALEGLYGAEMATAVSRIGSAQALLLNLQLPDIRYLPGAEENLLEQGLTLLAEMLTKPYLPDGLFDKDSFTQEKNRLLAALENRRNQRARYAQSRLQELVFADSPLAFIFGGSEEELKSLSNQEMVEFYQQTLNKSQIYIGLSGSGIERVEPDTLKDIFYWTGQEEFNPFCQSLEHVEKVNRHQEVLPGEQSQLFLALSSEIDYRHPLSLALTLFNGIYGAFAHSRLFAHVREEKGLAYATGSRFERSTGMVTAYAGLNLDSVEKAEEEMIKQLELLQHGDFSDDELNMTKETIIDQIRALNRDVEGKMDYAFNHLLLETPRAEELIEIIKNISRDQVQEAGSSLRLHTAYLLADRKG